MLSKTCSTEETQLTELGIDMCWGKGTVSDVDVGVARCATRGVVAGVLRGMLGDALLAMVEAVPL